MAGVRPSREGRGKKPVSARKGPVMRSRPPVADQGPARGPRPRARAWAATPSGSAGGDLSVTVPETLFTQAPMGWSVLDEELRIVRWHTAARGVRGLPGDAVLGRRPDEIAGGGLRRSRTRRALPSGRSPSSRTSPSARARRTGWTSCTTPTAPSARAGRPSPRPGPSIGFPMPDIRFLIGKLWRSAVRSRTSPHRRCALTPSVRHHVRHPWEETPCRRSSS
ncbi:PAS domain-containing protein [Streptomyces cinerochromogenes]|uniref:PAS domain-containing protein n=1 Tax=Streptomyces cinerochromogenes TaxID=66422 RepID=UPI0033A9AD07